MRNGLGTWTILTRGRTWRGMRGRGLLGGILLGACVLGIASSAPAAEPARAFLDGLREHGYFEEAVDYLEMMKTSPLAPPELLETIDYELGTTMVAASRTNRDTSIREKKLDEAQVFLNRFIEQKKGHPLLSAAQTQLGNLLVERARLRVEKGNKDSAQKAALFKEAGAMYEDSLKLFAGAETEVRKELESPQLKGVLDPNKQGDLIDRRDTLRREYLQTKLLQAAIVEEKADTLTAGSKEYKDQLEKAAKMYGEIHETYRRLIAGMYARLYQGRAYAKMGNHKDAISYYNDLLEQPTDNPAFRTLHTKTLLEANRSWTSQKQYAELIAKNASWEKDGRPQENADPDWVQLRLDLGWGYKHFADQQEAAGKKNEAAGARREAKRLAELVSRVSNDRKKDALELLGAVTGNEVATAAPDPKNFVEARQAGKDSLDLMQAAKLVLTKLGPRLKTEKDAAKRDEIQGELIKFQKQLDEGQADAIRYFELALKLADDSTPVDDVNVVRYFLTFLFYTTGEYEKAAIIGDFLAHRYPASSGARQSAKIAMAAWLKLYGDAKQAAASEQGAAEEEIAAASQFESDQVVRVADFITRTWPDQPEADEALRTLIPLMVQQGNLDRAVEYLEKIPAESPSRGGAELTTGQAMWSNYLQGMAALREAAEPGAEVKETPALTQLKARAKKTLADGIERMKQSGSVDSVLASATLSLAQIYVDTGEHSLALPLLEAENVGLLKLVAAKDPAVSREGFSEEAYKTGLRAYIGAAPKSENPEKLIKAAEGVMDGLRSLVGETEEGRRKLIAIYVSLARDLKQEMEIASPEARRDLSRGYETFLRRVGESATEINLLYWVAETFYSLGEGFDVNPQAVTADARNYYDEAIKWYGVILDKAKKQPGFADEAMQIQVQMRLAMTQRRLGDFTQALAMLKSVLQKKQMMLNVQLEAARTYQEGAAASGGDAEWYISAIRGAELDPQTRKPIIWGYGKIATITSQTDYQKFNSVFHEARYNLALCRYKYAMRQAGKPADKKTAMEQAKKDIQLVVQLYPDLGGAAWRPQYDALLKDIQKELGETANGLAAFQTPAQAGAQ